jgi:hypothetical protein
LICDVLGSDAIFPAMSSARRAGAYLLGAVRQAPDLDIVLAMAALVALLIDPLFDPTHSHVTVLSVVLAVATSAPLVVRRRFPLGTLGG